MFQIIIWGEVMLTHSNSIIKIRSSKETQKDCLFGVEDIKLEIVICEVEQTLQMLQLV